MVSVAGQSLNIGSIAWSLVGWLGWILALVLVLGIIWFAWYYLSFKYKVKIIPIRAGSEEKGYSYGKPITNYAKWDDKREEFVLMYPLFKGDTVSAVEDTKILPGKEFFLFRQDGEYKAAQPNYSPNPGGEIMGVYEKKQLFKNELEKIRDEFSSDDFWSRNKHFILTVVTVGLCTALALGSVWLTYKYAGGQAEQVKSAASQLAQTASNLK